MSTAGRLSRSNLPLWIGLAMISLSLAFVLAGSLAAIFSTDPPSGGSRTPGGLPIGTWWDGCMQGAWNSPGEEVESLADARESFETALDGYGNPDLEVAEVMEFGNNFYAEVREESTGVGAMELLIEKPAGPVYPEPGPNMMWNTRYGMTGGMGNGSMMGSGEGGMMGRAGRVRQASEGGEMDVTPEQARSIANEYLARVTPGTEAGEAEEFYGYYTLHTEKDGETTGMLSVNGFSGEVWYHSWHGPFVAHEE
jgi:hypothetical protein